VLVVEDEPLVAMMVEDMLLDLGWIVVGPASSLEEALRRAAEGGFEVALLDVNLNGERSDPVAELLRARGVPLVFATGYGSSTATGPAEPVLHKPYRADQLAAALDRVIGGDRGQTLK
jgi:CheY-like chemotaxis protein